MRCLETELNGVKIIDPDIFKDQRGWFMETYSARKMESMGISVVFLQDNHSMSEQKGIIRGLHFQNEPMAQSKLVRCTRGSVRDIVVDIRAGSPSYRKWISVELTSKSNRMLFIPKGFAHGFLTLEDNTEIQYKVDNYYSKDFDCSIRFDDPDIGIEWGIDEPLLSEKDSTAPFLANSNCNFIY